MTQQIGFGLPRDLKQKRMKDIVRELGCCCPVNEYVVAYRKKYDEMVSQGVVSMVLKEIGSDWEKDIESIAYFLVDVPQDKIVKLLLAAKKHGVKKVFHLLKKKIEDVEKGV